MRLRVRLASGVGGVVLIGHAALLALLYLSLSAVVQRSHERPFVQKVQIFSRLMAEQLSEQRMAASPRLEISLLDAVIRDGDGVYAELVGSGVDLRSALGPQEIRFPPFEDHAFGEHNDEVFFTRVPVVQGGRTLQLQLGFDEHLTVLAIADARHRLLWTLCAYLSASALAALVMGYLMTRSVRGLQGTARRIADGAYNDELRVHSPILELQELTTDLNRMRVELVGAAERLRTQMAENLQLEQRRAGLERQLQHHQRVETVGTLAGGIAHEFNNVLVPIILLTETALKAQAAGTAERTDLETVLSAARRARGLVRQILTFSRELDGLHLEAVDLRDVVREAMQLFKSMVSLNVRLTVIATDSSPVLVDRVLAIQLVMNLCTNAHQALRGAPGEITVAVTRVAINGEDRVELRVRDTGEGMDAATAARIFLPFFSTRPVGEGTGLGLSVVHGIVQSFGATIGVDSTPGKGSCFCVLFPIVPHLPDTVRAT